MTPAYHAITHTVALSSRRAMNGRVVPRPCNKKNKGTFVLINQGPHLCGNIGLKKSRNKKGMTIFKDK